MTSPPPHRSVPRGRRPSVEFTTARRCPSARRRSGAGFLPARRPAARVNGARRERFRVYPEDEFFAQADQAARLPHRDAAACFPAPRTIAPQSAPGPAAAEASTGVALSAGIEPRAGIASSAGARHGHGGVRVALATALLTGAGALLLALVLQMLATTTPARRRTLVRSARAGAGAPARTAPGARRVPPQPRSQRRRVRRRSSRREPKARSHAPAFPVTAQTREVSGMPRQVQPAPAASTGGSISRGAAAEFGLER
jgi:hypothetical protein